MATSLKNLSAYNAKDIPNATKMKFGIVYSEWNDAITGELFRGAKETLKLHGVNEINIISVSVPGSFELIAGARSLAENTNVDAVICLGCVVKGDTPHFEYVCQGVTQGIAHLNVKFRIPFIYGVLTTLNQQQAEERAGGIHGNKGDEAAITAIKMVDLSWKFVK